MGTKINIISTHGGGTIPYVASRITLAAPVLGIGRGRPNPRYDDLTKALSSFYFDVTGTTAHAALDSLRRLVPPT